MNTNDLLKHFPNASADLLARNGGQVTKLERDSRNATLVKNEVQKRTGQSILVRVTSVRKRLIDEDNLCEKYHVDLCRYAGIILGDEADKTKIEVCQRKIEKGEQEKTVIEVFEIITK